MASKSADESSGPHASAPPIFVSDASAEAERLSNGLRARGYAVVDVPLALLAGRVGVQRPSLIICDADAEGATLALSRLRVFRESDRIAVLFVAERAARNAAAADTAVAVFFRPLDVESVISKVEELVGHPGNDLPPPSLAASSRSPVLIPSSRPPADAPHAEPVLEPPPEPIADPSVAAEVDLLGAESTSRSQARLSPDLEQLLRDAEKRLPERRPSADGSDEPGHDEDVDVVLPADVFAALDEALEEDDDALSDPQRDSQPPSMSTGLTGTGGGDRETGASSFTGSARTDAALQAGGERPGTAVTENGPVASFRSMTGSMDGTGGGTAVDSVGSVQARREADTPKPPRPSQAPIDQDAPPTEPPRRPSAPAPYLLDPFPPPDPAIASAPVPSTTPPLQGRGRQAGPIAAGHAVESLASTLATTPPPSRGRSPGADIIATAPTPRPPRDGPAKIEIPETLRSGDSVRVIAGAVRARFTGALAFEVDIGVRRIVFRDGDFVTAASGVDGESLVAFLVARGDLPGEVARQTHRLPLFGRHAGAALIAQGHLAQDQLWSVLRAHAEWIVGQCALIDWGTASAEAQLVGRLQEEPAVFGGSTGAEILIEIVRRHLDAGEAIARLGGDAFVRQGPAHGLLGECALPAEEAEVVQRAAGATVSDLVQRAADATFAPVLYALAELGVLSIDSASDERSARGRDAVAEPLPLGDEIDDAALRERILARKALVDEGDYFALLGVSRQATGYEVRRAYTELRREFEPSRLLTARTADLREAVDEIVEVLEEAYEILRDQARRDRYRRAIEAAP